MFDGILISLFRWIWLILFVLLTIGLMRLVYGRRILEYRKQQDKNMLWPLMITVFIFLPTLILAIVSMFLDDTPLYIKILSPLAPILVVGIWTLIARKRWNSKINAEYNAYLRTIGIEEDYERLSPLDKKCASYKGFDTGLEVFLRKNVSNSEMTAEEAERYYLKYSKDKRRSLFFVVDSCEGKTNNIDKHLFNSTKNYEDIRTRCSSLRGLDTGLYAHLEQRILDGHISAEQAKELYEEYAKDKDNNPFCDDKWADYSGYQHSEEIEEISNQLKNQPEER